MSSRQGRITSGFLLIGLLVSVPLRAATLTVRPADLAPQVAFQGQEHIPLLRLSFSVDAEFVRIDHLRLVKTGNLPNEDVADVRLWFDYDADGIFDPNRDVPLNARLNLSPLRLQLDGDGRFDPRTEFPQAQRPSNRYDPYTSLAYVGFPPLVVTNRQGDTFRAQPGNFLGLDSTGRIARDESGVRVVPPGELILDGFNTNYDNSYDPWQAGDDGDGTDDGSDDITLPILSSDPMYWRPFADENVVYLEDVLRGLKNRMLIIQAGKERSLFVTLSLAEDATVGARVGIEIPRTSYIWLDERRLNNVQILDEVSPDNFPLRSSLVAVEGNRLGVTGGNEVTSDVAIGQREQAMLRLTLEANAGTIIVDSITVRDDGDDPDTDVAAVKLFRENPASADRRFRASGIDHVRDEQLAAFRGTITAISGDQITDDQADYLPGQLVGQTFTLRSGAEAGQNYTVVDNTNTTITLDRPLGLGVRVGDAYSVWPTRRFTNREVTFAGLHFPVRAGQPETIYLVYDFSPTATPGHRLQTRVGPADVRLDPNQPEDSVDAPPGGLASIITTLRARLVRATAQSLAPATLGQGQKRVRMLRLVLTAAPNSQGASVLTQVRVHKIGTSTDAHSTTDISRVQIFHDLNGNDLVDSADEELTDPLLTHIFPLGGTYLDVPLARPLIIQPGTSERLLFTYDVHPVSNTEVSIGAAFKQPARLEGTASAVAGNQLTDAQANYAPDSLGGRVLKIISGAEAGREFRITGNTATTITVAEDFSGTASGDRYLVSSDFFFSPTGVATDVTAEVVTDAAATYFPNELQGRTLLWLTGVEAGVRYSVQGNTATTITAAQPFNGARAGDRYVILNTLDRLTAIPEPVTGPVLASAETSIVDTVTVTGEDLAPLSVAQGDRAVIMQKLTFTVSPNPAGTAGARVTSLLVNKTGPATGRAEDVAFVHLYEEVNDANNNLRIDAGEGRLLATVSVVENAARFENLQLTVTQGKPQEIWLAVDVSPTATTDTALGLALSRPDEVGIASPDRVAEDNFPFATKQSRIGDALTIVGTSLAPVSAEPGQEGVPVQQLIFTTKTNEVTLIGLRVTLALRGNVSARARPSDFISFLSAVHDVNGNGTIDPADEVLGSGTYSGDFRVEEGERTATADITVAEGKFVITTDRAKYLLLVANVASVAQRGVEVSFRLDGVNPAHPNELAADNAVAVVFPDSVYPGTFPLSTEPMIIGNLLTIQGEAAAPPRIFRTQEQVVLQHLQLRASPEDVTLERITFRRLGTAPDVTFSALRLVHDDDGDGLFNPVRDQTQWGADETFAGGRVVFTPRVVVPKGRWTTIFLLADVVEGAPVGETIGAELAAATDVEVDQQSAVARTGFPISSGLATIGDGLAVEGVPVVQEPPIIAGQVGQGRENLALLALKLTPLTGSVTLTQLRVDNVEENDEDFAAVKLFVDTNGDGRFFLDPTDPRNSDTQIGTARRFGEAGFPGTVTFPNLNLTLQEPTLLFVAVDVSPNARISTPQNPNRLVIEVKDVTFSSTATGISGTVLTDTKAAFVPDQLVGQRLWFRTGAEAGVERTIVRNSRQTINVDRPFSGAQPGDAYTVTVPPSVGVQAPDVVAPFPDVDGDGNPDSIRSDRDVAAPEVQANKLSVTLTNLAPAQGEQGQPGVLMAQLRLSTTAGTLLLRSLQVALSGGGSTPEPGDDADVNDVERVRLFHDVDGDGTIDAGVDVEAAPVQTFTRQVGIPFAGIATFPSLNQTITPRQPVHYLIVYDFSPAANAAHLVQVQLGDGTPESAYQFINLAGDDLVELSPNPLTSSEVDIVGNTLRMEGQSLTTARIAVGAAQVPMLRLRFTASQGTVILRGLRIREAGTAPADQAVVRVRLFDDANLNDEIDAAEEQQELTAGLNVRFTPEGVAEIQGLTYTVTAGQPRQLIIAYDLSENAPVGESLQTSLAPEDVDLAAPDSIASGTLLQTSEAAVIGRVLNITAEDPEPWPETAAQNESVHLGSLVLTPGPGTTPIVLRELRLLLTGTARDPDLTRIRLLREMPDGTRVEIGSATFNAKRATFSLAANNVITAPTRLRLVVDVAPDARAGRTLAVTLPGATAVAVDDPQFVALPGSLTLPSKLLVLVGNTLVVRTNLFEGVATDITGNVLTDENALFSPQPNQLAGQQLTFHSGAEAGVTYTVLSNTDTALVVDRPFNGAAAGDGYTVTLPPVRAPTHVPQGTKGVVMQRLVLSTPVGEVPLRSIRIDRLDLHDPEVIAPSDVDVAAVKLYTRWHDTNGNGRVDLLDGDVNGNGRFDPGEEGPILLASGAFSSGSVTLRGLALNLQAGTARTVYLVFDIAEAATLDVEVGAYLANASYFRVDVPNEVATADPLTDTSLFPIASSPPSRVDGNRLQVRAIDLGPPAEVPQGTLGLRLLALELSVDSGTVVVNAVRVEESGSGLAERNVAAFRLLEWTDLGTPEVIDPTDPLTQIGQTTFTGEEATLARLNLVVREGRPRKLVLVYDLRADAVPGETVAVRLPNNSYLSVSSPDLVEPFAEPLASPEVSIQAAPGTLNVTGSNAAPSAVVQGQTAVPFQILELQATSTEVELTGLRVEEFGTGLAVETVAQVSLFRFGDDNANGQVDQGELRLPALAKATFSAREETTTLRGFNLVIAPGVPQYLVVAADIAPTAPEGVTVGLRVPNKEAVTVTPPSTVNQLVELSPVLPATIRRSAFTLTVEGVSRAPVNVTPGQSGAVFMELTFTASAGTIVVDGLTVEKIGTADDADIVAVRLFHDTNGNGVFDPGNDGQIGTSSLFEGGLAVFDHLAFRVPHAEPRTIFITLDFSRQATLAATVGVQISSPAAVTVRAPDRVSPANFPLLSDTASIRLAPLILGTSLVPNEVPQGAKDVPFLRVTATVTTGLVDIEAITITQTGRARDADIETVGLFADSNLDGRFEPGVDVRLGEPMVFTSGRATFRFRTPLSLSPTQSLVFFVVLDLANEAVVGRTVGVGLADRTAFTLTRPEETFLTGNFPVSSELSRLRGNLVTVAGASIIPRVVIAGQTNVPFESLVFSLEAGTAVLETLTVRRTGGTDDRDVSGLQLYRDQDQNGRLDLAVDTPVGRRQGLAGGRATFTQLGLTLRAQEPVYILLVADISALTPVGRKIGFQLEAAEDVGVAQPDEVAKVNFPIVSGEVTVGGGLVVSGVSLAPTTVTAGSRNQALLLLTFTASGGTVTLTGLSFTLSGTLTDEEIAQVSLFRDDNRNSLLEPEIDLPVGQPKTPTAGRVAFTGLSEAITPGGPPLRIIVAVDLSPTATEGRTLSLILPNPAAVSTAGLDAVSEANFPLASTPFTVSGTQVTVSAEDLAPVSAVPGERNVALLRLRLTSGGGAVELRGLNLERLGEGVDADVAQVRLHVDADADEEFDPEVDTTLAATRFLSGVARFENLGVPIPVEGLTLFVVVDVAADAPLGASIGVAVPNPAAVVVSEPATVLPVNFPLRSSLTGVLIRVRIVLPPGLNMVSVPIEPADRGAHEVFGLRPGELHIARWDPQRQNYRTDPNDPFVGQIRAGRGYWLYVPVGGTQEVAGVPVSTETLLVENEEVEFFSVPLQPGWNQIGHPFPFAVEWGKVRVRAQGQVSSLSEAAQNGRVSDFAWTFRGGGPYTMIHPTVLNAGRLLEPGFGYFVYAYEEVELLIPAEPVAVEEGTEGRNPLSPKGENWQVQLIASVNGRVEVNIFGCSSQMTLAPNPPSAPGEVVDLYFTEPGREAEEAKGTRFSGGRWAVDLRRPSGRLVWEFALEAPAGAEVTLTWPGLSRALPAGYQAVLRDWASGQQRSLHTQSNYRFRAGKGPRPFTLTVERVANTPLQITSVLIRSSRAGLALTYSLSVPAEVTVTVTGLNGQVVRIVEQRTARTAGLHTTLWDLRDERGAPVPNGLYLCHLRGTDAEGRSVQVVRALRVLR